MTRDIATVRLRCDERTKAYAARRTAQGKSRREILRCLKRYIAREIHQLLTDPPAVPAGAINACPNRLSDLERGARHDHDLAIRYHNWLTQTAA